jgi:predicted RNA-binding protein YlqC (UPF0109 family)
VSSIDQQFIEYIVKSLVSNPDAVKIERRIDEKGVLLELTVDPEDLGRVIGKRGATAQSLRTLLRALGTKNDARYNLKIVDNGEPSERRESRKESPKETSENEPVVSAVATDDTDDTDDVVTPDDEQEAEDHSSAISKTRKELAELDDLDV